jgi:hypothetical protein
VSKSSKNQKSGNGLKVQRGRLPRFLVIKCETVFQVSEGGDLVRLGKDLKFSGQQLGLKDPLPQGVTKHRIQLYGEADSAEDKE